MKQFCKVLLVLLLTSVCHLVYAQKQGQAAIDSMQQVLASAKDDTNKVLLLKTISFTYYSIDPDAGIRYGNQGLVLATRLNWQKGIAWCRNSLGINYQFKSDNATALDNFLIALHIFEDIGFTKGISSATNNIGEIYRTQSNYPKALEYYFKALKLFEETGNKTGITNATCNIGTVYQDQGDYGRSLEYYLKALKTAEETGNKLGAAAILGNIGIVYKLQNDPVKALEYYFKQLRIDEGIGNKYGIALANCNIGNVYLQQKKYEASLEYHQRSLNIDKEIDDKRGVAMNLSNMGGTLVSMVKDTAVIPPSGHEQFIPATRAARISKALEYLHQGLEIAKSIESPEAALSAYEYLADAYKLKGDYKNAMEYAAFARTITDSVFSKENGQKIMKIEYQRLRFADSLKADEVNRIAILKFKHQRTYTYMGIVGLLLALGFIFIIARNNKLLVAEKLKSEKLLKRSDDLLLNILPAEVANELKEKGTAAARHFDNVTVLFTDFVNFTTAGEKMSPQALIDELHTCFKSFDEIMGIHGIEKIKTIGDAYLAVAGLPLSDPLHARHVVKAAIAINRFMNERQSQIGVQTFEMRIGVHTGSVVAGIVGVKKFAYDIWGDTVNTAARMEQSGEAGRINISQTTYELVKDEFCCEYRGEIDAKNKVGLKMYFVS